MNPTYAPGCGCEPLLTPLSPRRFSPLNWAEAGTASSEATTSSAPHLYVLIVDLLGQRADYRLGFGGYCSNILSSALFTFLVFFSAWSLAVSVPTPRHTICFVFASY